MSRLLKTVILRKDRNLTKRGCDLVVMIRAFQALRPGSIPGARIVLCRGSQAWPTAQDLRSNQGFKGSMRHPVSKESKGSNPFPCTISLLFTGQKRRLKKDVEIE